MVQKLVRLTAAGPFGTIYLAEELLYDAPFYFYYLGGLRPEVRLTADRQLMIRCLNEQEGWTNAGVFTPTALNETNFDDYFVLMEPEASLLQLRQENARAWYLDTTGNHSRLFYYLLEQENGDLYLIYGFHKSIDGDDKSHFRWVFRLTQNAAALVTPPEAGTQ